MDVTEISFVTTGFGSVRKNGFCAKMCLELESDDHQLWSHDGCSAKSVYVEFIKF